MMFLMSFSNNSSIPAALLFLLSLSLKLSCCVIACPEIEKQSLLIFKQSLKDPSNSLSSWNAEVNCCEWRGVFCSNLTGHVHELHLQNDHYDSSSLQGLSGKINHSLLNLKHLKYVDLSQNHFNQTIPPFIGSLTSLQYLDLSGAGFYGKVPNTIGNLSNLHTLILEVMNYESLLHVDSLEWLSGLSKLEHLNMNFVDLSRATNNWPEQFLEKLLEGKGLNIEQAELPKKPVNKVIKFDYSDSSSSENDDAKDGDVATGEVESKNAIAKDGDESEKPGVEIKEDASLEKQAPEEKEKPAEIQEAEAVEPPVKKQCVEVDAPKCGIVSKKVEDKSIDKLIEAELAELGDKSKRRFNKLDTGCSGVAFIQMRKRDGDPTPKEIVHHMITSLASSKKHVSRFMLRVLPVEVSCYTSEEDIQRAIKPLIEKYFPIDQ